MRKIGKAILAITFVTSFSLAANDAGIQTTASPDVMDDKVDVLLGVGFAFSPGYSDFIDDVYVDSTGLGGWFDLYAGVDYKITPQLSVFGGVDFWMNAVESIIPSETYMNTILIPSVYVQYYFTEKRSLYVNGGIGIPIANCGSEYIDFSGDGVSLGANVGYAVGEGTVRIEAGYLLVPVKVESVQTNWSNDYDFGGFQFRFMFGF